MPSYYFKFEIYGYKNYGCPDYDLMGYVNLDELEEDCWTRYCADKEASDAVHAKGEIK